MLPWPTIKEADEYAAPLEWIDPDELPEIEEAD